MSKVLSIEVGRAQVRVAEVSYKADIPKLYNVFYFSTPADSVKDGCVVDRDAFKTELKKNLSDFGISTKKVIFVLTSNRVATREVLIPHVARKRIHTLLNTNASDYFPVDMKNYELIENGIEDVSDGEKSEWRVSLVAMPRDILDSYRKLADACGLSLVALDYAGNAVSEMLIREVKSEVAACLKVDVHSSLFTVMQNGRVALARNIGYGVKEAFETLADYGSIENESCVKEGLELLASQNLVLPDFRAPDMSDYMNGLRKEVTESFRPLIENVARIFDYIRTAKKGLKVETIYLVGAGANINGLAELMTMELGIKVDTFSELTSITLGRNLEDIEFSLGRYFSCIGGTLAPLDVSLASKDRTIGNPVSNPLTGAVAFFVVCLVVSATFVYAGLRRSHDTRESRKNIDTAMEGLADTKAAYDENKSLMNTNTFLTGALSESASDFDDLASYIGELEDSLPAKSRVVSMASHEGSIDIRLISSDKNVAAATVEALDGLGDRKVTGISEMTLVSGSAVNVTYTVTCGKGGED